MTDRDWSLAHVEEARGYYVAGHVLLTIMGQKPNPCHSVDIEKSLLTIDPPEFIARWYAHPGFCIDVLTPYAYQEVFFIGGKRETVKLHHADGDLQVPVQDLTQELDDSARAEFVPAERPSEATGYSDAWDFAEAFRDAIGKLPPGPGANIPDWLYTYEVTSIGAEIGGIAGFNRMYVKVRG